MKLAQVQKTLECIHARVIAAEPDPPGLIRIADHFHNFNCVAANRRRELNSTVSIRINNTLPSYICHDSLRVKILKRLQILASFQSY